MGDESCEILDRQRYWAFLKAYVICYVSLVGLYIVIDAFSNLDEFIKRAEGFGELLTVMGRYYLIHQALYFDQLGGVIGMMAAIFTVTWMQRNNEQLAMLAAGISTHRAIRPVLFSSVIVSMLSVVNQEVIIPKYAEEIQKSHDDDGMAKVLSLAQAIRLAEHHDPRQGGRPRDPDDHGPVQRDDPRRRSSARSARSRGSRRRTSPRTTRRRRSREAG